MKGAFKFPLGCRGTITVSGGINIDTGEDFLGELQAPVGATAVNSLTTMMVVGGLTEAEVKTSLGIPSTVNLLTTDPAAESGTAYSNSELFSKAKTVQQLFQTTMDSVATTSSVTDTDAKKAIYATAASASLGYTGRQGEHMVALFNTPETHNMVVCTLCSCYPWPVLGLPPVWYKSMPYRSRAVIEPREVLKEFGVTVPDEKEVRVWDSTAEVRYLVIPERPAGTEGWSEEQLAGIVTRNAMIGTGIATA